MKNILLLSLFCVALTRPAFAEDSVKIEYHPGMSTTDRGVEIKIAKAYGEEDEAFQKIFEGVQAIEATGRLEYLVPDAPYITLNVNYKGQTIIAKNATTVPKVSGFEAYQKAWDEVYARAWALVETRIKPQ